MKVNFVTEMTRFNRYVKTNYLSNNAQLLWFRMFLLWNETGFPDWLQVDMKRLMSMLNLKSRSNATRARDELITAGLLIKKRQAIKRPNFYQFVLFEKRSDWQNKSGYQTEHEVGLEAGHEKGSVKSAKNPDLMSFESKPLGTSNHQAEHERGPEGGHETDHLYKQKQNKQNKKACGEFKTVWLTDDETEKLKALFPDHYDSWIKRLDTGKAMKGYQYENDYAAILSWYQRDEEAARDHAYQELLDETDCLMMPFTTQQDKKR